MTNDWHFMYLLIIATLIMGGYAYIRYLHVELQHQKKMREFESETVQVWRRICDSTNKTKKAWKEIADEQQGIIDEMQRNYDELAAKYYANMADAVEQIKNANNELTL